MRLKRPSCSGCRWTSIPPMLKLQCTCAAPLYFGWHDTQKRRLQEQHTPMRFRCRLLPDATEKHTVSHRASCATQGGPGASALLGNFYELGPYQLTEDLERRENPGKCLSGRRWPASMECACDCWKNLSSWGRISSPALSAALGLSR